PPISILFPYTTLFRSVRRRARRDRADCQAGVLLVRAYGDFHVGDTYRSAVGRTVTESDNLLFTMLTLNTNELHFNEEAAKATERSEEHTSELQSPCNL